ncbi:XdhC family protein [Hymenobacter cavernae]|uniref:Xanthine dehydrogenase subunit A n=1 Tax=Hymenobacter cavernae TaxID=2044852 RepID=A0ABQ1U8U5_9BACT|nr:XdhC/CoxI family protein [Hymenobacter cavernae]GGF12185.1 putative xanthine dehydrogenase subunit A [Hymenobacter cavernae]
MTELQHLLAAYDAHRAAGRACALATVVHVEGSAYRSPGARMLVTEDGQLTGAISGGCLEGDARRRAYQAIQRRRPTVVIYDTTDEDDLRHGMGQGCQGIIHILLEPLNFTDANNPLELLRTCADQHQPGVLATVFSLPTTDQAKLGARLLLTNQGGMHGSLPVSAELAAAIEADAQQALRTGESQTLDYQDNLGPVRVFLEVLKPALRLTIYGAGNDVQPLVRLTASLGWRVRVVDGRPAQAAAARFPEAESVQVVPLAEVANEPTPPDYVLLMTHNYFYDLAALRRLLPESTPYIGLLGPRKKADKLLEELRIEGFVFDDTLSGRLYSPVGLNLGAETPEEIALSVVAEIQAVQAKRPAGFLRDTSGSIHNRPALGASAATAGATTVSDSVCAISNA